MSTFQELRIVDNFYQTSLFYPMPAVLVSTLTDDGKTTCGPYSLLAPFYVAGKPYYAFMLEARNSSNTAQNLTFWLFSPPARSISYPEPLLAIFSM